LHCGAEGNDFRVSSKFSFNLFDETLHVCGHSQKPHSIPECQPANQAFKKRNNDIKKRKYLFLSLNIKFVIIAKNK
jgi:hypothetical protein